MASVLTKPQAWQKRSVLFGSLAMLIGAVVAFDLSPAPVLYRVALGMDVMVVTALGLLFVRLTRAGMFTE